MIQLPFRHVPLNNGRIHPVMGVGLRPFTALALSLLLLLGGPAALVTQAQSGEPDADGALAAPGKGANTSEAFVIYAGRNGDTVCRPASLAETRRIVEAGSRARLRTIYSSAKKGNIEPLGEESDTSNQPSAATTGSGQQLLPSAGLRIVLRGTAQLEANPAAKQAFIAAANRWEALISTNMTVVIDVDYGPKYFDRDYGANVLGQTSTSTSSRSFSSVRSRLISGASSAQDIELYNALPPSSPGLVPVEFSSAVSNISTVTVSVPIARALGFVADVTNPDSAQADAQIGFNSNFQFDFNPDDGISSSQTDFDAVAVHEIGHALGFTSRAGRTTAPTASSSISVWDLFRFRPGTNLGTFTSAPRVVSADGEQVFFNNRLNTFGAFDTRLSTAGPDGESPGGDGEQSSHWKDDRLNGGTFIGIMDPRIPRGRREVITNNDLSALDSLGYKIGGTAQQPPPPPPPPANDNFANALTLQGSSGSVSGTNSAATKESGEPNHGSVPGGRSVWYRWTAPASGQATFDTVGSDYDTTLGVYTGGAVSALSAIGGNDDIDTQNDVLTSRVTFQASAGATYQIAVDGYDGDTGSIKLNWTAPAPVVGPNTVEFGGANYSVSEGAGSAVLTVTRTGVLSGPASISYQTAPDAQVRSCAPPSSGMASERCDFVTSVGTISFAASEGTKTIAIPIIDDAYVEGDEIVTVTLSTPTGTTLGAPSAAVLTIIDDDTAGVANPAYQHRQFVRQHYLDFLGREPDQAGYDAWTNLLAQCPAAELDNPTSPLACDRTEVSSAFFRSPEFQLKGYYVLRFYLASLGRLPGYTEYVRDAAAVTGQTEQELADRRAAFPVQFAARAEFLTKYPAGLTPAQYVAGLEQAAGVSLANGAQLAAQLQAGTKTRADVLREVVESQQVFDRFYNRAFVAMTYFGYLRRDPDAAGYGAWLDLLDRTGDYSHMVWGAVYSPEYQLRFGQVPGL